MTTFAEARDAYMLSRLDDDGAIEKLLDYALSLEHRIDGLERDAQAAQYSPLESERQLGEINTRLVTEAEVMQATIDRLTLLACQLRTALFDAKEAVEIVAETGDYGNTLTEVNAALDAAEAVLPLSENDLWLAQEEVANLRRIGEVQS